MNTSPSTPNLELLHKAVQEFQPNPRRVPFNNLKPLHDSILELRGKNASYATIAELLQQNGVNTSRARVAEYGRVVLEGGKRRKRRKPASTTPAVNIPATSQGAIVAASKVAPPAANVPSPPTEDSQYSSRGPHIAKVEFLSPDELAELNASHPPGKTALS
jgi:hypothetical protein